MTAPRRLLAAVLAMFALVAFALLLWHWLPGPETAAGSAERAAAPSPPVAVLSAAEALPPPRLRPVGGAETEAPAPMPEGLRQDLETFDGVQLKAELESIALSHPQVRVLEAVCSGLPCRAEAASSSAEPLAAFALAVHQRFQGRVSIRTERMPRAPSAAGEPLVKATFWVGTAPEPTP